MFHESCGIHSDVVLRKRHQKEVRLFKQAMYQNALFIYEQVSFICIGPLFKHKWAAFLTYTFPWELCHALDGFIIVLFHIRLSHIGIKTKSTRQTTVLTIIPHHKQLNKNPCTH
ncbi:hypothetical protein KIN20_020932 [Parelaphostrongylus tenuis]|uniref:7TM GPCR serpentine receptor class x (Srx) domain-containing protein n=1 Tax=Parelaphostrongylus tenuis TaxID=148309 RepID=A0AAD5MTH2_PARTN|nr:hypothetical protein KIN20_020932 [Parelaphostrongylus tenuis]